MSESAAPMDVATTPRGDAAADGKAAASSGSAAGAGAASSGAGAGSGSTETKSEATKEEQWKPEGKAMEKKDQDALKRLLFGSSPDKTDVERWHHQGFTFSKNEKIPWGLTQLYGGPCGILAPVQAWILKDLIFDQKETKTYSGEEMPIKPSGDQCTAALLRSLTLVIDRAARAGNDNKSPALAFVSAVTTDELFVKHFKTAQELHDHLAKNLPMLRSNIGVLLFVFSVLVTRGVGNVKGDMDDDVPLMARFGHCTQELVNLMLTGQAVTNVFDGRKVLDGDPSDPHAFALKGIPAQNDIGFLTLLESHRLSFVGENYKVPKVPVWIVGSTSHYTVLFALDRKVNQISEEAKLMQKTRASFNNLDPSGNGYIQRSDLGALLKLLGINEQPDNVISVVDPDNLGICLWENVAKAVKMRSEQPTEWDCSACTFKNPYARTTCDVCGGARPAMPKPEDKKATKDHSLHEGGGLKAFPLYHFNGLDGYAKAVAECVRMTVNVVDGHVQQGSPSDSSKRGLRDVIQTRWPSAIVEYAGNKEPKII